MQPCIRISKLNQPPSLRSGAMLAVMGTDRPLLAAFLSY